MSFDLEKFQAVAELGDVIRLQNEAMDRLQQFRKARPYLIMPNLAKMVEENMKENLQVLYKELNNMHKPAEQQTRYICDDCHMAFLVKLPGGICDECRAKQATQPREYVVNAPPVDPTAGDDDEAGVAAAPPADATAQMDPSDIKAQSTDISAVAAGSDVPMDETSEEEIAADAERAATGDKLPIEQETIITEAEPADVSGADSMTVTEANAAAQGDEDAAEEMSEEFRRFMEMAGTEDFQSGQPAAPGDTDGASGPKPDDD